MTACCALDGSHGDRADVHEMRTRHARKVHECYECCEDIPVGARYEHVRGVWEGSWSTYKTCLSCVEIRDHFSCEGFVYGEVWSQLRDNLFPEMRAGGPCMEGLSPAAKARLFEARLAWLEGRR